MGIGNTMKNMLSSDTSPSDERPGVDMQGSDPSSNADTRLTRESSRLTNSNRATHGPAHKLPSGTGPGTSGKPSNVASELAMQQDAERAKVHGISGYGTDAAAAVGGDLSARMMDAGTSSGGGTGLGSSSKRTTLESYSQEATEGRAPVPVTRTVVTESTYERGRPSSDKDYMYREREYDVDLLSGDHVFGHNKNSPKDSMPTANAEEDTNQLQPVTHERVRHIETEEISRVKDRERHIHHIQHHTQPIVAAEELEEQHKSFIHPVTHVREKHANKVEDNTLFEGQVNQFHDTLMHSSKERTIIDKGTTVNETVHHHVHHVIQPVIEKETIDRQHIHTTIPIHEVTHEAPVVHQSQTHAPVPMEHFLQRGGTLHGAISQEEISRKVLHTGQCTREVEGIAETMERDLNLKQDTRGAHTHSVTEDAELAAKKAAAKRQASTNVDQPTTTTTARSRN
ncbi:hypothetical protein JR316_0010582 [Psilocybe cubensis]|uniref:Uncharacterized protein n=1 Tax=Psilocybe cubensis TaxID=181762 RepID=A0ACB8GM99_PSICU|nr:hypothetical protein JR316_0010582 [Psilocybe cubensis]KAH9476668.1 hypothetical protein JR316_0010582 [Psilocybe cubensis]